MAKFKFVIHMTPAVKERPRVIGSGGSAWAYVPDKTIMAEHAIQGVVEGKGASFPEHIGVKLEAVFYRTEPDTPTASRVRQLCAAYKKPLLPILEPDLDEYYLVLASALETYCYRYDGQITQAVIKKRYCKNTPDDKPRIEFSLEEDSLDV